MVFAPDSGSKASFALVSVLFIGSSVHIGATAWFYTVPEVRAHMAQHRQRYLMVPLLLIAGAAVVSSVLSSAAMTWVLLAFFAWQFFHFQKQNLGVAALAARSSAAPALTVLERRAITAAGIGGIMALMGRPALLNLEPGHRFGALFGLGTGVFVAASVVGVGALVVRTQRSPEFVLVYLISLVFFLPVFLFSSPYAAVAGITVAHGLQYLLLVGMLSAAPKAPLKPLAGVLVFVNLALLIGLALNSASHLHGGNIVGRAVFGSYLGTLMAHFVIDAGLWRLRDEFPRTFLSERLPYLMGRLPQGAL
ncbi:MAG: hypothetical protein ACJ72L_17190 [Marmoricola sp.]